MRYRLLVLLLLTAATLQALQAVDAVYVVTYIEAMPAAASRVTSALQQYRDATRREAGVLRVDALERRDRAHHFALVEAWRDQAALDAHRQAPHLATLRTALQIAQLAPADERTLKPLIAGAAMDAGTSGSLAGPKTRPTNDAVYVLTHADSLPPATRASDGLKVLAEASGREEGNLLFEVLPQATRGNHFTIIEAWKDTRAHQAHLAAPHTKQFRELFQTVTGSLYDERWYRLIR